jgi:hypothetical protein
MRYGSIRMTRRLITSSEVPKHYTPHLGSQRVGSETVLMFHRGWEEARQTLGPAGRSKRPHYVIYISHKFMTVSHDLLVGFMPAHWSVRAWQAPAGIAP